MVKAGKTADRFADLRKRDITATDIRKERDFTTVKLRGLTGTGKTQFFIKELERAQNHGYPPAEILMCVVDLDIRGQDELVKRDLILPETLTDCFHRITIGPDDMLDDVRSIIDYFIQELIEPHAKKYPKGMRFLVVENEAAVYQLARDEYAFITRGHKGIRSELDLMKETQRRAIKGSKYVPVFSEGPRDAYKVINANLVSFYQALVALSKIVGFNLYVTTMMRITKENWGKDNERTLRLPTGRPDLTDGYFDYIFDLTKERRVANKKGRRTKHTVYWLNTEKVRSCPEFITRNKGPEKLWALIKKRSKEMDSGEDS